MNLLQGLYINKNCTVTRQLRRGCNVLSTFISLVIIAFIIVNSGCTSKENFIDKRLNGKFIGDSIEISLYNIIHFEKKADFKYTILNPKGDTNTKILVTPQPYKIFEIILENIDLKEKVYWIDFFNNRSTKVPEFDYNDTILPGIVSEEEIFYTLNDDSKASIISLYCFDSTKPLFNKHWIEILISNLKIRNEYLDSSEYVPSGAPPFLSFLKNNNAIPLPIDYHTEKFQFLTLN